MLDEATAFADPENEGKILAAFSHLIKGKTVLVIAHRLSTITNADRILYVDKGVIAEQGTHEQLLALKGEYARMWETLQPSKEVDDWWKKLTVNYKYNKIITGMKKSHSNRWLRENCINAILSKATQFINM